MFDVLKFVRPFGRREGNSGLTLASDRCGGVSKRSPCPLHQPPPKAVQRRARVARMFWRVLMMFSSADSH